jgi:hypothetical protein
MYVHVYTYTYTMEYYSAIKKNVIYRKVDGTENNRDK